jgi:hypothetical protein
MRRYSKRKFLSCRSAKFSTKSSASPFLVFLLLLLFCFEYHVNCLICMEGHNIKELLKCLGLDLSLKWEAQLVLHWYFVWRLVEIMTLSTQSTWHTVVNNAQLPGASSISPRSPQGGLPAWCPTAPLTYNFLLPSSIKCKFRFTKTNHSSSFLYWYVLNS